MKKQRLFFLIFMVALGVSVFAQTAEFSIINVDISPIPQNIDEFLAIRDEIADTPEGGAALFVLAMYLQTINEDLGLQALTVAMDRSQLVNDPSGYRNFSPARSYDDYIYRYLARDPHIARSYFSGTDPGSGYELPSGPLTVATVRNRYSILSEDEIKVFVYSSGADSPRPVTLKRNNRGVWKALNSNSLFVGVRPPQENIDDDL